METILIIPLQITVDIGLQNVLSQQNCVSFGKIDAFILFICENEFLSVKGDYKSQDFGICKYFSSRLPKNLTQLPRKLFGH